jgi:hypothetical protein
MTLPTPIKPPRPDRLVAAVGRSSPPYGRTCRFTVGLSRRPWARLSVIDTAEMYREVSR